MNRKMYKEKICSYCVLNPNCDKQNKIFRTRESCDLEIMKCEFYIRKGEEIC